MKEKKKSRRGRNPKKDPAVFRYTVRFIEEKHTRFPILYERRAYMPTHFYTFGSLRD